MIVQALSGVMSITGEVGRPAVRLGIPAGDTVAGLYACIAICAALHRRNLTDRADIIDVGAVGKRSEEHTSELQSLMRISYAVFCLKKKKVAYKIQTNYKLRYHNQSHIERTHTQKA